ncbi:i-AAA protease yme1 [Tieghemiomyces parasiticus]|uniref:I-AAA protease yme1 n=1 Tax=Tieghemiomyces parasiticus TaxID=78921 RepID=A0A9W8ACJ7_9FUNG|nr:i-AAA protease yme1 [Tieghemiomyces parasiticus]
MLTNALRAFRGVVRPPHHFLTHGARHTASLPLTGRIFSTLQAAATLRPTPASLTSRGAAVAATVSVPSHRSASRLFKPDLDDLEEKAQERPDDLSVQNAYFRELRRRGINDTLIDHVEDESGVCAMNEESLRLYTEALVAEGQSRKLVPRLFAQLERRPELARQLVNTGAGGSGGDLASAAAAFGRVGGTSSDPVRVIIANKPSSWVGFIQWIVGGMFITMLLLTLASVVVDGLSQGRGSGKDNPITPADPKQKVTFDDVQGCTEAKDGLREVVDFLRNPDLYTDLGARLPKGVLLTGPPGTGKTLLARAVAGEADVPFFFMSGSEFDEMYVGVGARRVRDLFAAARAHAPAIVFIDEIDAIGGRRGGRDMAHIKQTLNQLLVDLDGFSPTEGVVFIGATNFPELLDPALVRPGRFDRTVHVPLPDVRGRVEILKLHAKKITLDPEVDLTIIARGTPGFSGADLHNLINDAAIRASRERAKAVSMHNLEQAKDTILMGAERKSAVITEKDRRNTAFHEGGHALVAYYVPGADPLHKATIMPRGQALGMVSQLPEMDRTNRSRQEMHAHIAICMGGRLGEEFHRGYDHVTSGASSDLTSATHMARAMVTQLGMSEKVGPMAFTEQELENASAATKQLIESEVRELLLTGYETARTILTDHSDQLALLANTLLERETLSGKDIEMLLEGKTLPPILTPAAKATDVPSAIAGPEHPALDSIPNPISK